MPSWNAWQGGLGRALTGLGADLNDRRARTEQRAMLEEQRKRTAAQDALNRLIALSQLGGVELGPDADPTVAMSEAQQFNTLRSRGGSAIPLEAMGIPEESTPDAYGSVRVSQLPDASGRMSNVLLDPSRTPQAMAERRASLSTAAQDRRQQRTLDAQAARASEAETARLNELAPVQLKVSGKAVQGAVNKRGEYFVDGKRVLGAEPYEAPRPQQEPLVQVQQPDGQIVYIERSKAAGMQAPSRAAVGSAALKKAVASNHSQLSVIDDALKEIEKHPQALGMKRGIGEMIPFAGNVGDAINQRVDFEGVPARASLANISSLVIHDRSGTAVTVSEFPRLAPFIPRVSDTPETAKAKLAKLRQAIQTETDALGAQLGGGGVAPSAGGRGGGDPEAAWAAKNPPQPGESYEAYHQRYLKSRGGGMDDADPAEPDVSGGRSLPMTTPSKAVPVSRPLSSAPVAAPVARLGSTKALPTRVSAPSVPVEARPVARLSPMTVTAQRNAPPPIAALRPPGPSETAMDFRLVGQYEKNGHPVIDTERRDAAGHVPTHRLDQVSGKRPDETWQQYEDRVIARTTFSADTSKRNDLASLNPAVADSARSLLHAAKLDGVNLGIGETRRTQERQEMLFQKGRAPKSGGVVTWTLTSDHTPGRAIDFSGDSRAFEWLQRNAPKYGFQVMGAMDPGHVSMP